MNELEGIQAILSAGSRPRGGGTGGGGGGGGGGRPGGRRHSVACCSLDLFCYECRRRKRQQEFHE